MDQDPQAFPPSGQKNSCRWWSGSGEKVSIVSYYINIFCARPFRDSLNQVTRRRKRTKNMNKMPRRRLLKRPSNIRIVVDFYISPREERRATKKIKAVERKRFRTGHSIFVL